MGLFDSTPGLSSFGTAAQNLGSAAGNVLGVAGTVSRVAGALNNLSNPAALVSALRGINLPTGGNVGGKIFSAGAQFVGTDANKDWRVRLSMPTTDVFTTSPILQPLLRAGGLVFPYTPQISINHSASYAEEPITHQNYTFMYYQNSKASDIQISGSFSVEDSVQAQYWIAAVHYLRSITKMFTGDLGEMAGNPPPIVYLNGYGDYVFKNIPVVVKAFNIDLPADVNYIATNVGQEGAFGGFGGASGAGGNTIENIANTANTLGGVAGAFGSARASRLLGAVGAAAGVVNGVRNLAAAASGGGGSALGAASNGTTHVPVKSSLNVTVVPIYSRENIRKFNLKDFVNGNLLNNTPGYI